MKNKNFVINSKQKKKNTRNLTVILFHFSRHYFYKTDPKNADV